MHKLWEMSSLVPFAPPPKHNPKGYCAIADDCIRKFSSSGGVFSVFANYFIKNGGVVCGAEFDNNWHVKHSIVDNIKDLDKLRRSKYVQSSIGTCYKDIKNLLKQGKSVFFVGVPCQVAGLYKYLGNKKYNNLLTMDLYCHNVPSPKVFEKLLSEYGIDDIKAINFRDKSRKGWKGFEFTIKKTNEDIICNSEYVPLFVDGYFSRKSCYNCKYAKFPRVGDITGADFWGADTDEFDTDNKGTSILLVNSKKGEEILQKVKTDFKLLKKVPLKSFGKNGLQVQHKPLYREEFIKDAVENSVLECFEKYTRKKVLINNLYFTKNYGAVLVGYAMQEIVKNLGYIPFHAKHINHGGFKKKFIEQYIAVAPTENIQYLNDNFNNFIVGSDQIWNPFSIMNDNRDLILKKILPKKIKIAYAASFGVKSLSKIKNSNKFYMIRYYLNQFDYISTREFDGVDICKNELNVNAIKVLEPVFVVNKQVWERIAQDSVYNQKSENYILTYILDTNTDKEKIISFLAKRFNLKVINIDTNIHSPQDFVALIKNCEFIVTDSFHGCCFSVIFHKKFIGIYNEQRGISRFHTLEKLFNINERFIYNFESEKQILNTLNHKTDWAYIDKVIKKEGEFSLKWLKNCLDAPKNDVKTSEYDMFHYLHDELYRLLYLLTNKNKILNKYRFYKLLKNITFGSVKKNYENKFKKYNSMKKDINIIRKNKLNICLEK